MIKDWIIRAVWAFGVLVVSAFAAKHYLIEPYSVTVLQFDVELDRPLKKGDKGGI